MPVALLLFNLIVSAFLTGLIWFVQIVHYPIFTKVPASHFVAYQTAHMQTTGYVVALPMLMELVAGGFLLRHAFPGNLQTIIYLAFALIVLIWMVTFFVSVPIHNYLLSHGPQQEMIARLVATNWIRTFAWTLRTVLLAYLIMKLR